ncbi:MAG: formyltransferase family protein [Candidatus Margulisiibacteriota bacterium]
MNIVVFGYSRLTKICVEELTKYGHKVFLINPKSRSTLLEKLKFSELKLKKKPLLYSEITQPTVLKAIHSFKPDYIFSIIFGEKIPDAILNIARKKALNIHPSDLPDYRSANSWFWVIRMGERKAAITVHEMTQIFDSGNIVYKQYFDLGQYDTQGIYTIKVEQLGQKLMSEVHKLMINDSFTEIIQGEGRYYPALKLRDILIDWNQKACEIEAMVRAGNPDNYAQTYYNNFFIAIPEIEITDTPTTEQPGTIQIIQNNIYVATSDFMVRINVILIYDIGTFSGNRFLKLFPMKQGDRFQNIEELSQYTDQFDEKLK